MTSYICSRLYDVKVCCRSMVKTELGLRLEHQLECKVSPSNKKLSLFGMSIFLCSTYDVKFRRIKPAFFCPLSSTSFSGLQKSSRGRNLSDFSFKTSYFHKGFFFKNERNFFLSETLKMNRKKMIPKPKI